MDHDRGANGVFPARVSKTNHWDMGSVPTSSLSHSPPARWQMHTCSSKKAPKAPTPVTVFDTPQLFSKSRIVEQRAPQMSPVPIFSSNFQATWLFWQRTKSEQFSGQKAIASPQLSENSVPQLQSFQTMTNLLSLQLLIQNQCPIQAQPKRTASYCKFLNLPETTFQKRSNWLLRAVEMLQANYLPVRPWSKASSMAARMASYWPGSKEPEACQSPPAQRSATRIMKIMRRLLPSLWREALVRLI